MNHTENVKPEDLPERWWGWGTARGARGLEAYDLAHFLEYLQHRLGDVEGQGLAPIDAQKIRLPPSRLAAPIFRTLAEVLGPEGISRAPADRAVHALGQSYGDLVRRRRGEFDSAPDAVIFPTQADQVQAVLSLAAREGLGVVPYGGGTSVVGGVEPLKTVQRPASRVQSQKTDDSSDANRPIVTLDLRRLNRVLRIDERSHLARAQAGILGPDLERALAETGLTLGHFPQSFEFSTLGGWIATRSWGQFSTRYGSIADRVRGVRVATPGGTFETFTGPGRSTGPEIQDMILGSEGVLGIIVDATVEVDALPETRRAEGYLFPSFGKGLDGVRRLMHAGLRPFVCRLSDTEEMRAGRELAYAGTSSTLRQKAGRWWLRRKGALTSASAVLILGFEGTPGQVDAQHAQARRILRQSPSAALGTGPAQAWERDRFRLPYLRDVLIERGYLIETFETGGTWDQLETLYARLGQALAGALSPALVMAHLSHPTGVGGCLYFTAMGHQERGRELEQWRAVKETATTAILDAGGSLSHHHGVGADHLPWMGKILGSHAARALWGLKRALDPHGIMNPGKLLSAVTAPPPLNSE